MPQSSKSGHPSSMYNLTQSEHLFIKQDQYWNNISRVWMNDESSEHTKNQHTTATHLCRL